METARPVHELKVHQIELEMQNEGLRDVASCVSLPTSFRMRCDREASTWPQAAATLATFGDAPRHLGGDLGVIAILHTWGQTLGQHLHLHCVVTGGALSRDGTRWPSAKRGFLFPVRALAEVFRGKYLDGLRRAFDRQGLRFAGSVARSADPTAFTAFLATLRVHDWVVHATVPFAGPAQVLESVGRYPSAWRFPTWG